MAPEDRVAFADRARQIASDMNAKAAEPAAEKVDVEVEDGSEDAE